MKKTVVAAIFASLALSLSAANYLHIRTDAGWTVLDLDNVDRITFTGGNMTVTDEKGGVLGTFKQEELQSLHSDEIAGIAETVADSVETTFTFDAASRSVTVTADGDFTVYDAAGNTLVAIPGVKKGETIDLGALQPGVVIMTNGTHSLKALIK